MVGRCGLCLLILMGVATLAAMGPASDPPGTLAEGTAPRDTWSRGDVNCDGAVSFGDINVFVLALSDPTAYATQYPGCPVSNADLNDDGAVDFRDINPFVARLASGPPHIGESSPGECIMPTGGRGIFCPEDVVTFWVTDGVLHMQHENAEYNCCADDIEISLLVAGVVVHLEEQEILLQVPCPCLCCYEPTATVVGLPPGTYTVELCWLDADSGWTCHVETIVVP